MSSFELNPITGLLDLVGSGGGSVSIGDAIGSGAANRVLYLDSTPVLAQSADFLYDGTSLGLGVTPTARLHVEEGAFASAAVVFQGYSDGGFGTLTTLEIRNEIGQKVVTIAGSNSAGVGDYGGLNLHGYATSSEDLYSFGDFTWFNNSGEATGDLRMGGLRIYRDGDPYQGTFQIYLRDSAASYIVPFIAEYTGTVKFNYMLELASASDPVSANQLTSNISGFLMFHDGTAARSVVNKVTLNSGGTIYSQPTINFIEGTNVTIGVTTGFDTVDVTINSSASGGGGNSVTTTLAFGASFTDKAQTVVTGQAWVTLTSEIVVHVLTPSGVDPDEMRLLDFKPVVSDLVAGDGFTVTLYSESEAKGDYEVMCIGV
jgi:hypothetical protein